MNEEYTMIFFKVKQTLLTLLSLLLFIGCSEEEIEIVAPWQHVVVIFTPGGLGDRSYNDLILKGLQDVRTRVDNVEINFCNPETTEEAEFIFSKWLDITEPKEPTLLVLASAQYEEMANRLLKGKDLSNPKKAILLFESRNPEKLPIYYFRLPMYGASYLTGYAAAQYTDKALTMLGNGNDIVIQEASYGFKDGYEEAGKASDVVALSEDWHGYVMAGEAYQKMYDWTKEYDFIYPVAGGSNMGVYRYLREYPKAFTAGMDVEQSNLSSQIIGSMIKKIDFLVAMYITQWLRDKTMPTNSFYGLGSTYTDFVIAPKYSEKLTPIIEKIRNKAIQKEIEYYENK